MNFVIILATSLIVFILFRLIMSRVYCLIKKLLKSHEDSVGFSLSLSVVFFILYLQGYLGAIQGVMRNTELTNLEWYLVYTSIGMIAMLWCYFSWSFERGTKPQFSKNDFQTSAKKILVYLALMLFVFYQTYTQLNTSFGGTLEEEKELLVKVLNITIVPGIIAMYRVLNQINNLIKIKKN